MASAPKTSKALAAIALTLALLLSGCSDKTLTKSNLVFDTVATITIYKGGSQEALDGAFETMVEYDSLLDAFDGASEIGSIGVEPTKLSEGVYGLLEENINFAKASNGAFSPTLGALIALWNINSPETREPPGKGEVAEALGHTDLGGLTLDKQNMTAMVSDAGIKINLGASAKGFVADLVKEELVEAGVTSAIINLGGNVLLIGGKGNGDFSIGIENPQGGEESPIAVLHLRDKSIVTSGDYQRFFTDAEGNRYHHILDPATGYPADSGLKEVVVVSDTSLQGDMLSTALFVMGREKGIKFLKENYSGKGLGAIFVTDENTIWVSEDLRDSFEMEPDYEKAYKIEYFKI